MAATMDPTVAPPTVAGAVAALEAAYPPALAQDWDAVGLVCGDPGEPVTRVLVAVDPTPAVVDDAVASGTDLLVTHHPLLLRGVHGVPADEPKGSVVHRLIRAGCALFAAHTNADAASPGVSDALADAVGVVVERPLAPEGDGAVGIGRIGHLDAPEPFAAFVERVSEALPATAWGVRGAGDPDRTIRRVALSGGAGDSMLGLAREAGVDAYITADLRHHPADEHLQRTGAPALVDVAHWASEHPWCTQAAEVLRRALPGVPVTVSTRRTDPWTLGAAEREAPETGPMAAFAPPTMHDVIDGPAQPWRPIQP
jgi:dinuclear metal center YbgI/SA1388 family protein